MNIDETSRGLAILQFPAPQSFYDWLADNHDLTEGIWIRMAKQGSNVASITSDEAVDVGLCWGWISSHRRALDENYYLQKYTPRRPSSNWSKVNVEKVARLSAEGKIRPPGQREIDEAKADGRWKQNL